MRPSPKPNDIFKHFKGNCYRIVTLATHSETRETLVIYQALYGDFGVYARPLDMFMSPVDKEKYPDVDQVWRFEMISDGADMQDYESGKPVMHAASLHGDSEEAEAEQVQPEKMQSGDEPQDIDSGLLQYLDAETSRDRLQILLSMKDRITDEMINTMAMAIDVEIDEGPLTSRYEQLEYCLTTRDRFECTRLR